MIYPSCQQAHNDVQKSLLASIQHIQVIFCLTSVTNEFWCFLSLDKRRGERTVVERNRITSKWAYQVGNIHRSIHVDSHRWIRPFHRTYKYRVPNNNHLVPESTCSWLRSNNGVQSTHSSLKGKTPRGEIFLTWKSLKYLIFEPGGRLWRQSTFFFYMKFFIWLLLGSKKL